MDEGRIDSITAIYEIGKHMSSIIGPDRKSSTDVDVQPSLQMWAHIQLWQLASSLQRNFSYPALDAILGDTLQHFFCLFFGTHQATNDSQLLKDQVKRVQSKSFYMQSKRHKGPIGSKQLQCPMIRLNTVSVAYESRRSGISSPFFHSVDCIGIIWCYDTALRSKLVASWRPSGRLSIATTGCPSAFANWTPSEPRPPMPMIPMGSPGLIFDAWIPPQTVAYIYTKLA